MWHFHLLHVLVRHDKARLRDRMYIDRLYLAYLKLTDWFLPCGMTWVTGQKEMWLLARPKPRHPLPPHYNAIFPHYKCWGFKQNVLFIATVSRAFRLPFLLSFRSPSFCLRKDHCFSSSASLHYYFISPPAKMKKSSRRMNTEMCCK